LRTNRSQMRSTCRECENFATNLVQQAQVLAQQITIFFCSKSQIWRKKI